MVFTSIINEIEDRVVSPRESGRRSDVETQVVLNTDEHYNKDALEPNESTTVNFRNSGDKDLKANYPFGAIDGYNGSSEKIVVKINQRNHLVISQPPNSLIGDSFPDTGIFSITITNRGSDNLDLSDVDLTISKNVEGVERANV